MLLIWEDADEEKVFMYQTVILFLFPLVFFNIVIQLSWNISLKSFFNAFRFSLSSHKTLPSLSILLPRSIPLCLLRQVPSSA